MGNALWFTHDYNAKDDPKIMMMIDELGLEGYGIFWVLIETLRAAEPEYKYPLRLIPSLSRKYATTAQKMGTVITAYNLFELENDEFFLSRSLKKRMKLYDDRKKQAQIAAKIGVEKRRIKQQKQLQELSDTDSIQRPLSDRRAIIEENRIEENKKWYRTKIGKIKK